MRASPKTAHPAVVANRVHRRPVLPRTIARAVRLPGVGLIIGGWAVMLLAHFAVLTYIAPFLESVGVGQMVGAGLTVLGTAGLRVTDPLAI